VRLMGHHLLYADTEGPRVQVRLYNLLTGKDVWAQQFAGNSKVMKTEDPDLIGAIEPGGKVRVVSLSQKKEVLTVQLDKDNVEKVQADKAQGIYLLRDANYYYVAVHGPADPDVPTTNGYTGVQPNLQTNLGLRAVPVHGEVIVFNAKGPRKGERNWQATVHNQMLLIDQFEDMPMMLFTARYSKTPGGPFRGNQIYMATGVSYEKRTGKMLWTNENLVNSGQNFHSLVRDPANRKIDFISQSTKVTFPYDLPVEGSKK
jgi:hypothetical protein